MVLRRDYRMRYGEAIAALHTRIAPIYLQLLRGKLSGLHAKHVVEVSEGVGKLWLPIETFLDSNWHDAGYGGFRGYIERSYDSSVNPDRRFRVRHYLDPQAVLLLAVDLDAKCDLCRRRLKGDPLGILEMRPVILTCAKCCADGQEAAAVRLLKREILAKKNAPGVVA